MDVSQLLFSWTVVETNHSDTCVVQQHKTELFRSAAFWVGKYSKNWVASHGREHTDHSKAVLLGLAQKLAHHGPLLPVPHQHVSNLPVHPRADLQHLVHFKVLHHHTEMVGESLQLTDTWHLAQEATNSREVGAVQPEGNYLEILSWDLTTTVSFTIDIARLSHHPSYCFVIS